MDRCLLDTNENEKTLVGVGIKFACKVAIAEKAAVPSSKSLAVKQIFLYS